MRRITILALVFASSTVSAQEYSLTGTSAVFSVGPKNEPLSIVVPAGVATGKLTIKCSGVFDCTKVSMAGDAKKNITLRAPANADSAVFEIPTGIASTTFDGNVTYAGVSSTNTLTFSQAAADGKNAESQLADWLATLCDESVETAATFLTTPFGRVIKQTKVRITDRDRITVSVLANPNLEPVLSVREGSELATPSVTNIYGSDAAPFKNTSKTPGTPIARVACHHTKPTPLGPFASPKGTVNIVAHTGTEEKQVGTFQFQVNPTYTGSFSLGGGLSSAFSPTFEKSFNGADTVVVAHGDRHRFLYVATYTPYVYGPRDLGALQGLTPRIFPFVGIVLNDVTKNALAGFSIELQPGFAFIIAQHVAHVTMLDTSTGAAVGKPFANRAATVPTDQHWTSKPFYGVLIDAHAATGLLKSLFGAPK